MIEIVELSDDCLGLFEIERKGFLIFVFEEKVNVNV